MARIFPEKMPFSIFLFVMILSIWSGISALQCLVSAVVVPGRSLKVIPIAVMMLVLLFSIKYLLQEMRTAWIIVLAVLVIFACYSGTVIVLNFIMFFNGAELYRDSPATIYAVVGIVIFELFPAIVLLVLTFAGRKYILDLKNEEI